jgi:phosphodiesterase/alkaline phosphatase D-like protein
MTMKAVAGFFLLFWTTICSSQNITHGPVLGAMTDTSFRMYIRTSTVQNFTIEIDTDSLFSAPLQFQNQSQTSLDNSVITEINGLASDTRYYYRVLFNSVPDIKKGNFKTFPTEGQPANFTFVTGSCQETANMKVYDVIPTHNPLFMVHTGDFTYPSYQLPSAYPSQWYTIPWSYRKRYEEQVMKEKLFPNIPLVYMPDDDDNFGNNRTHHVRTSYTGSNSSAVSFFITDSIYPVEIENCLRGYRLFFPGYPTVDTTEGHYHSFKVGNAEFFVLDCRSMADATFKAYRIDSATNRWVYDPAPTHSIIGTNQRNWLLNGLSNSTADWKFIVSGVPFNPKIRKIIDAGLLVQNIVFNLAGESGTGLRLSASFAGYWGGYPNDVEALTSHISSNGITGVLVVSGDTHHNVMDDGTNSVYPEMNASGLSVTSTELAYQIAQYAPLLGQPPVRDSLWNGGGNGLYNTNFLNGFGKVQVFGSDSVQYCIIDEDNVALSCMTIYADGSVYNPTSVDRAEPLSASKMSEMNIFPNPNNGEFNITIKSRFSDDNAQLVLSDISGKQLLSKKIELIEAESQTITFKLGQEFVKGTYFAVIRNRQGAVSAVKSFQKF